ncbi:MAG: hypothetical protein OER95_19490, partial [Acidimicrobiia bacterium]|nr:hypothetical protein [Acidimicrobiia bacterium]
MLNHFREAELPRLLSGLIGVLGLAGLAGPVACSPSGEPILVDVPATTTPSTTVSTLEVVEPSTTSAVTEAPIELPPVVVYDTDMGADVDDVLALAMLHVY